MNRIFTTDFKTKSVKEDTREVDFVATKEIKDRQGEVIKIDGIDLKNYKKNPIILWAHNHNDLPIGKATKLNKNDGELGVRIQFADASEYSFADTVYKLVRGGYLGALSIGFLPDYKQVIYDEKSNSRIYNSVELLEISVVPVPANQASLVSKAISDGVIDDIEFNEWNSFNEQALLKMSSETEELTKLKTKIDELTNEVKNIKEVNKSYIDTVFNQVRKDAAAAQANANSQTDDYTEAEMEEIMDYLEFNDKENK